MGPNDSLRKGLFESTKIVDEMQGILNCSQYQNDVLINMYSFHKLALFFLNISFSKLPVIQ